MAKKPSTSVALWMNDMAQAAKAQSAAEAPSNSFKSISTRGGILSIDDNPVRDNELRCIILASAFENQRYEGAFNANQTSVPTCFALSLSGENMMPHENSQSVQSESCDTCWANEMGSADTGRGKACKNIRRLILITEDSLESAEAFEESETRMVKVPVTSVKNWAKYVHRIVEETGRPSWGVITLIKLVPDPKTQFKMQFMFEELIEFTQSVYEALQKKIAGVQKEIIVPYAVPVEEEEASSKKARFKPAPPRSPGKRPAPPGVKRGKF